MFELRKDHLNNKQKYNMNLLLNDIVLINENEMLPKNHWHREVIHVLLVGRDNQVRGAVLRVLSKGKVIHIK